MRKPIIAGNWKMNKTPEEAVALVKELIPLVKDAKCDVVVCPPAVCLGAVKDAIAGTNVKLGAQNVHFAQSGAYTGELSADMLKAVGCTHVIIGHSERRQYFGETDKSVNRRTVAAVKAGLTPIICVGELKDEREDGYTDPIVCCQTLMALTGLTKEEVAGVVVAYEPVWAIGTGESASPEQIEETHGAIRQELISLFGFAAGSGVPILYGGSAGPGNIGRISLCGNVSGFLIGTASLDVQKFIQMMDLVNEESQNPGETGSGEAYGIAR